MLSLAMNTPGPGNMATTPLKSALKRTHSDIDEAHDDSHDPQRKRCKVQFNEADNKTELFWNDKSQQLVKEEVRRAIEKHIAGDSAAYHTLKEVLTTKPAAHDAPSPTLLKRHIVALISHTTLLGKRCGDLVGAILDCSWLGRDEDFVACYRRLLVNLISAHGGHAQAVMEALVDRFVNLRRSLGRLPDQPVVRRSQLRERLHLTIKYIVDKLPLTLVSLKDVLSSSFPYTTDSVNAHVDYVSNLLRVPEYASTLKSEILSLTMERLVKIDVLIQIDIDELEDELDDGLLEEIIQTLERNRLDSDNDESASEEEELESVVETVDPKQKRLLGIKASVTKLDVIIDMVFEHMNALFAKSANADKEALFEQMISIFNRSILPTYRSRHVQFVLFHFGQSLPSLGDRFAESLTQIIFDKNQPRMVKQSAATYLASFIARSAHIQSQTVVDTFNLLSGELERLRVLHEKGPSCCPDLLRFSTYYAIFQALLYIFCFRWRDLLLDEEEDDDEFDPSQLRWEFGVKEAFTRNMYSPLNPLKICAPIIVAQFAKIVHQLQFLFIGHKIELNKRIRLTRSMAGASSSFGGIEERQTALSLKTGESMYQLDAYFPFDPYQLPRSKRWIAGDYLVWKPVPGTPESDDEESDSGEDDVDEEEDYDEPTETESDLGA